MVSLYCGPIACCARWWVGNCLLPPTACLVTPLHQSSIGDQCMRRPIVRHSPNLIAAAAAACRAGRAGWSRLIYALLIAPSSQLIVSVCDVVVGC